MGLGGESEHQPSQNDVRSRKSETSSVAWEPLARGQPGQVPLELGQPVWRQERQAFR